MRKFMVNVNGNQYEVEVEEVAVAESAQIAAQAPIKPSPLVAAVKATSTAVTNTTTQTATSTPTSVKAVEGKGAKLTAPLPGVVLKFAVQSGAKVKKNDVILIIEAMKMENEIRATEDGVITFVITQGASVNSGDLLAYIV
ncbi:MAG: biotin/lipoyl-containing protein [Clostridia bacterium]